MAIWLPALLLTITWVLCTQMGHTRSFYISTFQDIFNNIRNFSIQWFLTPKITLWKFGNPLGFPLPKWELIWECGGSFFQLSCILGSMKCNSHTFASPCLGHKPKVKVTTVPTHFHFFKSITNIQSTLVLCTIY